jgi:hypothetical protein
MKIYLENFNGIFDGLVSKIGKDLTTDWREADTIVLWQDVIGGLESVATQAKMMGKRVIVAEHGLLSINDYLPPLNRPIVADTFMAWGAWTKAWLVNKAKIAPERIVVTGTLLTDKLIPRREHEDKRVLFTPRHWDKELRENLEVADELKKCGYTVFSKLLEGENNPQNYPHPISSDRQELNHIEMCFEVLSWADVVVGVGEGTMGALAHLMDIPYISVDNWIEKDLLGKTYSRKEFNSQISPACHQVPLNKLNGWIDWEIKHPGMYELEREKFRKECLNYPGDPLKRMLEVIYK